MSDTALRFKRVEPHPGETRRYVTDTGYGVGTYIITRRQLGSWAAWTIVDGELTKGWRCIARGQRTMAAARIAAGMHRTREGRQ